MTRDRTALIAAAASLCLHLLILAGLVCWKADPAPERIQPRQTPPVRITLIEERAGAPDFPAETRESGADPGRDTGDAEAAETGRPAQKRAPAPASGPPAATASPEPAPAPAPDAAPAKKSQPVRAPEVRTPEIRARSAAAQPRPGASKQPEPAARPAERSPGSTPLVPAPAPADRIPEDRPARTEPAAPAENERAPSLPAHSADGSPRAPGSVPETGNAEPAHPSGAGTNGSGAPASRAGAAVDEPRPQRTAPRIDASWRGNVPPAYPASARRMGDQGEVRLDVRIGADGSVQDVKLQRSSGSTLLDRAAIDAVRQWRFDPATVDGVPVAEWYRNWRWVFRLEDDRRR